MLSAVMVNSDDDDGDEYNNDDGMVRWSQVPLVIYIFLGTKTLLKSCQKNDTEIARNETKQAKIL